MSSQRKIAAHYVLCPHLGLIPRAILTFDGDGILCAVESNVSSMDSLSGVEFYSGMLIPCTVNAHTHLELSYLKGEIAQGRGLTGFIADIGAKRRETTLENVIACANYQDSVMQSEGVIATGDICNGNSTFEIKKRSKIKYHNFIELFGLDSSCVASIMDRAQALEISSQAAGLRSSITPHSTYSLSKELFGAITEHNNERLSIHFMESLDEKELYSGKGALAKRYSEIGLSVDFIEDASPAKRLVSTIASKTPILLIHNTFVTQQDIDLIMGHFRDVTWVVCPRSNAYIEGAKPPLELLYRNGCRVAIGTDSLASNTSLSMIDEIAYIISNYDIAPQEIIRSATLSGAEALGLESRYGSFELGKTPGVILLDSTDLTKISSARRII